MQQAIAYIRVSSNGQVEGTGLDRQRESLEAFAKAAGYDIVATYADEGVSGTVDGFDRPGLADLANNVEEGQVVLVENADRLARDLLVSEVILGTFREHGVRVIDCAGIDLTNIDGDPTRTLIRQVLGAVAEFNKSQLVGRLASARRRFDLALTEAILLGDSVDADYDNLRNLIPDGGEVAVKWYVAMRKSVGECAGVYCPVDFARKLDVDSLNLVQVRSDVAVVTHRDGGYGLVGTADCGLPVLGSMDDSFAGFDGPQDYYGLGDEEPGFIAIAGDWDDFLEAVEEELKEREVPA